MGFILLFSFYFSYHICFDFFNTPRTTPARPPSVTEGYATDENQLDKGRCCMRSFQKFDHASPSPVIILFQPQEEF